MLKAVIFLAERDEPEMSVRRRHVNFLADFNDRIVFHAISYEVADAHKLEGPHSSALRRSSGRRAIVPSSLMISIKAATG